MIKLGTKHIRVFFIMEKDSTSSTFTKVKESIAKGASEIVNDAGALVFIESRLIRANGKAEVDKVINEKKGELTPMQIEAIYTLYEFGEIGTNEVGKDTVRGGKKFFALKEVLKKSTNEPHIMTFSNGGYTITSISEYKKTIANNPEQINVGVVKGFFNLHKRGSKLGFPQETWENIAAYCASRNWITNIIGSNSEIAIFLGTTFGKKVKKEEDIYDGILKNFIGNLDDSNLTLLLTKNRLEKTIDGKIDIRKLIKGFKEANPNLVPADIPILLKNKSEDLKNSGEALLKKAREEQKTLIDIKDLKSLNIPNIPPNLERKLFASFDLEECNRYIPLIDEVLKKEKEPKRRQEIEKVKGILIKTREGYELNKNAAGVATQAKEAEKHRKKNPNADMESIIQNAESTDARKKESLAGQLAIARTSIEQGKSILNDMNINTSSFEVIQKQYHELIEKEKKTGLTIDEERRKAQLYSLIQANIREAQVVKNYSGLLTEADIKEVFVDTNRFISNKPSETHNFKALEKIAILTDPESTVGQKSLARLEVGQVLPMSQALEGEIQTSIMNAPELQNINISRNPDGTYNIPMFNEANISKKKLDEYKENTKTYAELGLSQFIPHIPLISAELRAKGINTVIDGNAGTTEQQQVLKSLYNQLFGKEIISSSLGDVERAFSSALGNPTNMKNAMQHTLKTHKLIAESGRAIGGDILTAWIRKNKEDNNVSDPEQSLT